MLARRGDRLDDVLGLQRDVLRGPPWNSRYSSIWLFRFPSAGSLIGNLIFPSPPVITFDISAEYSVWMSSSEKCVSCSNPSTRS